MNNFQAFIQIPADIQKIILLKYAKFIQYKYWAAEFYMVNLHRMNRDSETWTETLFWEKEFDRYAYLMHELSEILKIDVYR